MSDIPIFLVFTLLWVSSFVLVLALYLRLSFGHMARLVRRSKSHQRE